MSKSWAARDVNDVLAKGFHAVLVELLTCRQVVLLSKNAATNAIVVFAAADFVAKSGKDAS